MKNLKAYKQIEKDYQESREILDNINSKLSEIGRLDITNSLNVESGCSDSTFLFALGVLDSRIQAGKTLGVSIESSVEMRKQLIELHKLDTEYDQWCKYSSDLAEYKSKAYSLLTKEEQFSLLEKPVKPGK